jgi:peptidoglycan/xylan/chitin deacetylase (PgdA/CDA1 family)
MNSVKIDYQKLLRGQYEAERLPKDFSPARIVPDFAFNILNPLGFLYKPVVDEEYMTTGGKKPVWPDGKTFAVCLTHDVDLVTLYSHQQVFRAVLEALRQRVGWEKMARALLSFGRGLAVAGLRKGKLDPLHCYEQWLKVETTVNAHSTFFIWPGWSNVIKHHPSDCTYELRDKIVFNGQKCTVSDMIKEIDLRGWEVGLHPSWYSYDNIDEMKKQKEALEKALGHEIVSVRQHFLHYDIRVTPSIQAAAGFRYDSTIGFNDNIGFRFGTSYPCKLYDLHAEAELDITEIPLVIQDGALLNPMKGMRLDEETAFQYVGQLTEAVERVGGVLTILWHPNSIANPSWWNLYLRCLEYLKKKNAWFGTVKEIGECYNKIRTI